MKKLHRVGVSTWSFHTFFERDRSDPTRKPMDVRDFPEMIADKYHVHNVEIVLPHFGTVEPSLVRDFKSRLEKAHSKLVHMPLDYGELWNKAAISSPDRSERDAAIALYKKGIDAAAVLGCPLVRCDPGKVNLDDPSLTIDSYKLLAAYAGARGIEVVVENHGNIAKNPETLVTILRSAGVGSCRTSATSRTRKRASGDCGCSSPLPGTSRTRSCGQPGLRPVHADRGRGRVPGHLLDRSGRRRPVHRGAEDRRRVAAVLVVGNRSVAGDLAFTAPAAASERAGR